MYRPTAFILAVLFFNVAGATTVTFDSGFEGWVGPAPGFGGPGATIETTGGNPGADARIVYNDFGVYLSNSSNAAFIGDLRDRGILNIGVDVKTDDISFAGHAEERDLVLEIRSHALAQNGLPWASVYIKLTSLNSGDDWRSASVNFDPASATLPPKWGGYGAEDPKTGAPMLPDGITFADVMGSVDEMVFTTLTPGYFYDGSDFNVRFDNLRIGAGTAPLSAAPALSNLAIALLGLALALGAWFSHRRSRKA